METDASQRKLPSQKSAPPTASFDNTIAQDYMLELAGERQEGQDITSASAQQGTDLGYTLDLGGQIVQETESELLSSLGISPGSVALPASERAAARRRRLPLPDIHIDDRLGRILLSIMLAALLWVYVVSLENPTLTVPFKGLTLDVRGVASKLKVMNTLPTVDVVVQAPQSVLSTLGQADIHPYLDLTGLSDGVHNVPVRADVDGGKGRDLTMSFSPGVVQVQLETQLTRSFEVTIQTQGTAALGYGLEPAQVSPPQVNVTGPQDAMSRVSKIVVQVDVEGKAGTQQGTKTPIALDSSGQEVKGLQFDPPTMQVVVPIKLLLNYKVVPVRVPLQGQPALGYRVSSIVIEPTNVTVCCAPNLMEPLQFLDTLPVSISGTTSTVVTSTDLILPTGVELYPGQPKQIHVTVSVEAPVTTLPWSVTPSLENLAPDLSAVVSPNKLDLTLSGTFAQLQSFQPADIKAQIDLQGKGPGTYSLKPQVIVPQGVKLDRASPDTVTVTLIAPTAVPVPTQSAVPTHTPQPATSTPTSEPLQPSPTLSGSIGVASPLPLASSTPVAGTQPTLSPQATRTPTP